MPQKECELYYLNEILKPEYLDAVLTEEGIKQCLEASLKIKEKQFDNVVYVSPLRRTI